VDDIVTELELLLRQSIEQVREKSHGPTSGKEWFHVHDLFLAFTNGVLRADPWYRGYTAPDNLNEVLDYIASCIDKHFGKQVVINITVKDCIALLRGWAMDNLNFRAWNVSPDGNADKLVFTSRYDDLPKGRDFIDLDAVFQNAAVYLRDLSRLSTAKLSEDMAGPTPNE
jgi:hypothetical protein